ncbi:histone H2A-like [Bombus fervidus]|uniref:histone H2A-like n=1 Tax=Bombus fervidus TaxID=203811 RepID=UPI003AB47673
MSSCGKGEETKAKGNSSRLFKAELEFLVSRIYRLLRKNNYAKRVEFGVRVYLTALIFILGYLTAEVLELTENAARDNKKFRIIPRHVQLASRNYEELNKLLFRVTIRQGDVLPNIQTALLPNKNGEGISNDISTKRSF